MDHLRAGRRAPAPSTGPSSGCGARACRSTCWATSSRADRWRPTAPSGHSPSDAPAARQPAQLGRAGTHPHGLPVLRRRAVAGHPPRATPTGARGRWVTPPASSWSISSAISASTPWPGPTPGPGSPASTSPPRPSRRPRTWPAGPGWPTGRPSCAPTCIDAAEVLAPRDLRHRLREPRCPATGSPASTAGPTGGRPGPPGGRLYLHEIHPVAWALADDSPTLDLTPTSRSPSPSSTIPSRTYTDADRPLANIRTYEWNHGIGEVVDGAGRPRDADRPPGGARLDRRPSSSPGWWRPARRTLDRREPACPGCRSPTPWWPPGRPEDPAPATGFRDAAQGLRNRGWSSPRPTPCGARRTGSPPGQAKGSCSLAPIRHRSSFSS